MAAFALQEEDEVADEEDEAEDGQEDPEGGQSDDVDEGDRQPEDHGHQLPQPEHQDVAGRGLTLH